MMHVCQSTSMKIYSKSSVGMTFQCYINIVKFNINFIMNIIQA